MAAVVRPVLAMTNTVMIRSIAVLAALNATVALFVQEHRVRAVAEVVTVLLIASGIVIWLRRTNLS
jgi:hypothetical protein